MDGWPLFSPSLHSETIVCVLSSELLLHTPQVAFMQFVVFLFRLDNGMNLESTRDLTSGCLPSLNRLLLFPQFPVNYGFHNG